MSFIILFPWRANIPLQRVCLLKSDNVISVIHPISFFAMAAKHLKTKFNISLQSHK